MGGSSIICCNTCSKEDQVKRTTLTANLDFGYGEYPLRTVIKFQSIMRGVLTRKHIKEMYGFEVSPGLYAKNALVEMSISRLEAQRAKV